jgi:thioredoxin-dependent peroxiredoxin
MLGLSSDEVERQITQVATRDWRPSVCGKPSYVDEYSRPGRLDYPQSSRDFGRCAERMDPRCCASQVTSKDVSVKPLNGPKLTGIVHTVGVYFHGHIEDDQEAGSMASSQAERTGQVTFKGNPMTLIGPKLKVGDKAPDFHLMDADLGTLTWDDVSANGTRAVLMVMVASIDTSVCSLETGKFNKHVASLAADKVKVVAISADTPFAQKRWANKEQVNNLQMLSDHKSKELANAYGVHMKELGLLARAIYLIDRDRIIRYIQTVPEVATEPDYDAVMKATRDLIGA